MRRTMRLHVVGDQHTNEAHYYLDNIMLASSACNHHEKLS